MAPILLCAAALTGQVPAEPSTVRPPPKQEQAPPIIVTGERVPRSMRETGSSVAVVTSGMIDQRAALDRVDQILDLIPNVQGGSGGEGPSIRGQDTTGPARDLYAFLGGTRPRTTLIVDGRPVSFNEFIFGVAPIWDVDRVEVFRSPQTTTQGKNSIAGAIFIHTQDPAMVPEYRARGIIGQAHTRQLSAVISEPIIEDELAVRLTGDLRYSHPSSNIRDNVPGADADHDAYGLVRFKLLATPQALAGARIELTYSHTQSEMPGTEQIRGPDFRNRQDLSGFAAIFRTNVDSVSAAVRYDFAPDLFANAVITRGASEIRRFALPGLGQTEITAKDLFAETVVNWAPEGPVAFVGGISHGRQRLRQHINLSRLAGEGDFKDRQRGTGVFGEARFALFPKATLTAGLRYQRDSQLRVGALGTASSAIRLDFDRTFQAWLPKASFAYDFTPDFRLGALVQRAYNPGGTTLRYDTGTADPYDAEKLWDYELFARASFAGGALTAAANIFYYDMQDAQRARPILIEGVGFADLFNVPKARSSGIEAQIEWRASRRLSAAGGVGMLRTRIVRAEGIYGRFEGMEFQRAPHFSGSASVEWRPAERLRLSTQLRHNSGYWSDDENSPARRIDAWTRLDGRAEWETGRFKFFGYARNVLNDFYLTYLFNPTLATAGDPRELGIGMEARF